MTRAEARKITVQASEYAMGIALQMIDEIPLEMIPNLSPTQLLKSALDETEKIMRYRRDNNKPHPNEAKRSSVN